MKVNITRSHNMQIKINDYKLHNIKDDEAMVNLAGAISKAFPLHVTITKAFPLHVTITKVFPTACDYFEGIPYCM